MQSNVEIRVRAALQGIGISVDTIANHTPLALDSLAVVHLHDALEEDFAIRIKARDVLPDNFSSIAALINLVQRHLDSNS